MRRLVRLVICAAAVMLACAPVAAHAAPLPRISMTLMGGAPVTFDVLAPETETAALEPLVLRVRAQSASGLRLTFSYHATDFIPVAPATTTMPPDVMRFDMTGDATYSGSCSAEETTLQSEVIPSNKEFYTYSFNCFMSVPWEYDPGDYASTIVFTAVVN